MHPIIKCTGKLKHDMIKYALSGDGIYLNLLNDINKDEKKDKPFKIRPLFEVLRQNCLSQELEEHNSTDEQIIPFKGSSFLRCYMPNKSHKWVV